MLGTDSLEVVEWTSSVVFNLGQVTFIWDAVSHLEKEVPGLQVAQCLCGSRSYFSPVPPTADITNQRFYLPVDPRCGLRICLNPEVQEATTHQSKTDFEKTAVGPASR